MTGQCRSDTRATVARSGAGTGGGSIAAMGRVRPAMVANLAYGDGLGAGGWDQFEANAVLFGVPMLKAWCHDMSMSCCSHGPRSMRKERKFIPWKQVQKSDPWTAHSHDVQDEEVEEESEEARVSTATANSDSASGSFAALRRQHSSGARRSMKQLI